MGQYEETPDNGIVIFVGIIDGDMKEYVFDALPSAVPINNYHCDKTFNTEPVYALLDETASNGLIVVSRGSAAIGKTTRAGVTTIAEVDSLVQGKTRAGGQSAQRFARIREKQKDNFFKKIARISRDAFVEDGELSVERVVVGGPSITVDEFTSNPNIDYRIKNSIIGTYSVDQTDADGLTKLYEQSRENITTQEQKEKEELLDTFFKKLKTDIETVTYGTENVSTIAEWGAIDTLLVGSDKTVSDDLKQTIAEYGGTIVEIPHRTARYDEFIQGFDGVAALCRYPVDNGK